MSSPTTVHVCGWLPCKLDDGLKICYISLYFIELIDFLTLFPFHSYYPYFKKSSRPMVYQGKDICEWCKYVIPHQDQGRTPRVS